MPSFDLSTIIIKSDSDELALDGIVIPDPARITAVVLRAGDATVDSSSYDLPDTDKINLMTMFPRLKLSQDVFLKNRSLQMTFYAYTPWHSKVSSQPHTITILD